VIFFQCPRSQASPAAELISDNAKELGIVDTSQGEGGEILKKKVWLSIRTYLEIPPQYRSF
jgi:hypothetical protein